MRGRPRSWRLGTVTVVEERFINQQFPKPIDLPTSSKPGSHSHYYERSHALLVPLGLTVLAQFDLTFLAFRKR